MATMSTSRKDNWCRDCGEQYPDKITGRPGKPCPNCGGTAWRRRPIDDRVLIDTGGKKDE